MAFFRVLITVLLATGAVAAQGGGGAPSLGNYKVPTRFEVLSGKLDLDYKVQEPAADKILGVANQEALAIIPEMFLLRQRLLGAELEGRPEVVKLTVEAYVVAATKMAAIEAQAFKQLYAALKPNQHKKAPDGFLVMGGMFLPLTAPATRGGGAPSGGGAPGGGGGGR